MRSLIIFFIGLSVSVSAMGNDNHSVSSCVKKMQEAYRAILDKKVQKSGITLPSRPPSEVIVGNNGALSWVDGSGNIRVSNSRGSYVVGRSCQFEPEYNDRNVAADVKGYMQMYDVKYWKDAHEICKKAGVLTLSESMSSIPGIGNGKAESSR